MFSHSTPIFLGDHFRSSVKKFGDHLGSGIISGRVQTSRWPANGEISSFVYYSLVGFFVAIQRHRERKAKENCTFIQ